MFRALFGQVTGGTAVKNITPNELQEKITNKQPILVLDVRQPEEYAHQGHVEGSRLMPLGSLRHRMSELPHGMPIVCVCRSGARSRTACELLQSQGFADVTNLGGGMIAWKRARLPHQ
ncbi:rhodanese-like domain-containing protein [Candidatus Leptofilum sp.]|uniref:rhodanese-like domain-containing protein n=1 Tax=Candidatus Leptofilum sp. TaxID=3241576 RepID=UPI003B5C3E2C